jgi:nucleotide-binding universal stress UspA family protein
MAAKPIVAGTDGSEESLRAVDWAAREAALRGAPLRIVAAAEAPPGMKSHAGAGEYARATDVLLGERDQALAAAVARAAKTAPGVLIDTDSLHGPAALAVTESGAGAQMLVLGSRGIGAFTALLLGSVSRYAASHASCPVALLDDWRAKYPDVPVSQEVVHGHPGRALVGLSARADLVVIGRHAKHPGLPGAVTVPPIVPA